MMNKKNPLPGIPDQHHALQQLIRSYGLQIAYLRLLAKRGVLHPDGAQQETALLLDKMDCAAERLCQLRLAQQHACDPPGRAIDPSLIPDLQYI